MKVLFILLAAFLSLGAIAQEFTLNKKFGVGGGYGFNKPMWRNKFDRRADGKSVMSLYGRYQHNPYWGFVFGYTRYEWQNTPTAARIYDVMGLYRFSGNERGSFLAGLGIGAVDIANYNIDENLKAGLRARVGYEYALTSRLFTSLNVEYLFVGKMIGERRDLQEEGEFNALSAQIHLSYFFGK